jgi:hypothetical protein
LDARTWGLARPSVGLRWLADQSDLEVHFTTPRRSAVTTVAALGICLEEYAYPHPVGFFPLQSDLQSLVMAYMDVPPGGRARPNRVG